MCSGFPWVPRFARHPRLASVDASRLFTTSWLSSGSGRIGLCSGFPWVPRFARHPRLASVDASRLFTTSWLSSDLGQLYVLWFSVGSSLRSSPMSLDSVTYVLAYTFGRRWGQLYVLCSSLRDYHRFADISCRSRKPATALRDLCKSLLFRGSW